MAAKEKTPLEALADGSMSYATFLDETAGSKDDLIVRAHSGELQRDDVVALFLADKFTAMAPPDPATKKEDK